MLNDYMYLNGKVVAEYLSALENGSRTALERRTEHEQGVHGGVTAGPVEFGGNAARTVDETESLSDTDHARFSRLVRLAKRNAEEAGWEEVLDPDAVLPTVGFGAILEIEADVYIPDFLKSATAGNEFIETVERFRGAASLA